MQIWSGPYKPGLVIFLVAPSMMKMKPELSTVSTSKQSSLAPCQKRCLVSSDGPVMLVVAIQRTFLLWVLNYPLAAAALVGLESYLVLTMRPSSFGNGTAKVNG